jgi:hypothetical protein
VERLADAGVKDTQCGFKLFRFSVAQELFSCIRMNGFSFDVEVLLMARKRGYRVAEVPVNWTHQAGSKVRLAGDSIAMAIDLFRIRASWIRAEYCQPHLGTCAPSQPVMPLVKTASMISVSDKPKEDIADRVAVTSLSNSTVFHPT